MGTVPPPLGEYFRNPIYPEISTGLLCHRFSFPLYIHGVSTAKLSNLSSFERNLNIMNEKKIEILEKRNKHFTRLNVTQVYKVSTMTGCIYAGGGCSW